MRLSPQVKRAAILSLCVVGLALVVLSALCGQRPIGYFGCYKLLPHASTDVLHFTNGIAILETCCGDETVGTYGRSSDGSWIWLCVMGKKKPVTNEFVLRPGLFSITCIQRSEPTNIFRLPRRLSAPKENGEED